MTIQECSPGRTMEAPWGNGLALVYSTCLKSSVSFHIGMLAAAFKKETARDLLLFE